MDDPLDKSDIHAAAGYTFMGVDANCMELYGNLISSCDFPMTELSRVTIPSTP